jgi:hypothetical protein
MVRRMWREAIVTYLKLISQHFLHIRNTSLRIVGLREKIRNQVLPHMKQNWNRMLLVSLQGTGKHRDLSLGLRILWRSDCICCPVCLFINSRRSDSHLASWKYCSNASKVYFDIFRTLPEIRLQITIIWKPVSLDGHTTVMTGPDTV